MKTAIKWTFAFFWALTASFCAYLVYSALQNERDPQLVWAWLVTSGLVFLSVTWLTATVMLSGRDKESPRE